MTMTISSPPLRFARRPLSAWSIVYVMAFAVALVAMNFMSETRRVSPQITAIEWQTAVDGERAPSGGWRPYQMGAGTNGAPIWIRIRFDLSEAERRAGTAVVALPGAFAARAYLNGAHIGSKGGPAFTAEGERPGPIDAVLPLGPAARTGVNELLLFVSAHHAHFRQGALLNAFQIMPRGGEAQRPLARYGLAISQVGVLLAIVVGFAGMALRRRSDLALRWAAAGAAFLLLAIAAETTRVWWSYPYPYHVVRLNLVWLALTGFAAMVLRASAARYGGALKPALKIGVAVFLPVAFVLVPGIDDRTRLTVIALLGGALAMAWRPAAAGDGAARGLALIIAVAVAALIARGPEVIDNWIYVLGALLLATFALPGASASLPPSPAFDLEGEIVSASDIILMKAAGNYVEIFTADGRTLLIRRSLTEFATGAPLMRVHRSYIVNLDWVTRLVAKTGSRYVLELRAGGSAPVSRKLVDAVRTALAKPESHRA